MKSLEQTWGPVAFERTAAGIPIQWEMKNGVPVGGWRNSQLLLKVLRKLPDSTFEKIVPKVFRGGRIPNDPRFRGKTPRDVLLEIIQDPQSTAGTLKVIISALIEVKATL